MIRFQDITEIMLKVNGERRKVAVKPSDTLLRVIREKLGLTGTKIGCENGDCGACTVLLNGEPVKSCMILAVECASGDDTQSNHRGEVQTDHQSSWQSPKQSESPEITTIEGLKDEKLKEAFISGYGFQCGFCTSGFMLNSHALIERYRDSNENPDDVEIKDWLSGNLCRCTGYEGIERAVKKTLGIKMPIKNAE